MRAHWPDISSHHRCLCSGTMQEGHSVFTWHLTPKDIRIQQHRIGHAVRYIVKPQHYSL